MTNDEWRMMNDRWQMTDDRSQMTSDKWPELGAHLEIPLPDSMDHTSGLRIPDGNFFQMVPDSGFRKLRVAHFLKFFSPWKSTFLNDHALVGEHSKKVYMQDLIINNQTIKKLSFVFLKNPESAIKFYSVRIPDSGLNFAII